MVVLLYCPLKGIDVTFNRPREGRSLSRIRRDDLQEVKINAWFYRWISRATAAWCALASGRLIITVNWLRIIYCGQQEEPATLIFPLLIRMHGTYIATKNEWNALNAIWSDARSDLQTYEPTTPRQYFFCSWSPKCSATMDPSAQLFQDCWTGWAKQAQDKWPPWTL